MGTFCFYCFEYHRCTFYRTNEDKFLEQLPFPFLHYNYTLFSPCIPQATISSLHLLTFVYSCQFYSLTALSMICLTISNLVISIIVFIFLQSHRLDFLLLCLFHCFRSEHFSNSALYFISIIDSSSEFLLHFFSFPLFVRQSFRKEQLFLPIYSSHLSLPSAEAKAMIFLVKILIFFGNSTPQEKPNLFPFWR